MAASQPSTRPHTRAFRSFFADISIEPILFFYNFQFYGLSVIKENLKLDRFCRITLGYGEEECALLNDGKHTDLQVEVQRLDSVFLFYERVVATVVPILLMSFIASWSDQRGRKIPIIMSLTGTALYLFVYLLTVLFPSWPPEVLLLAAFLNSIGGGWVMIFMASYSYMADKTCNRSRILRMTVMNAIMHLGDPCGTAFGAWLFSLGGYTCVYGMAVTVIILCIVLTLLLIEDKEPELPKEEEDSSKKTSPWNPKNVIDLFRICFKKRPGRGRLYIILLMTFMFGIISTMPHNLYLWCRRVFLWDENQYSLYSTVTKLVEILVMLGTAHLIRHLGLHDCSVGAGSAFLVFIKLLFFGLLTNANQWWIVYIFIFVPVGLTSVADRGMLSKLCEPDEVGRIFSLLAILEVIWPLIDGAIYAAIYTATIEFYPSYEHLVSAAFGFYVLAGFLMMRYSMVRDEQALWEKEDQEKGDEVIEKGVGSDKY